MKKQSKTTSESPPITSQSSTIKAKVTLNELSFRRNCPSRKDTSDQSRKLTNQLTFTHQFAWPLCRRNESHRPLCWGLLFRKIKVVRWQQTRIASRLPLRRSTFWQSKTKLSEILAENENGTHQQRKDLWLQFWQQIWHSQGQITLVGRHIDSQHELSPHWQLRRLQSVNSKSHQTKKQTHSRIQRSLYKLPFPYSHPRWRIAWRWKNHINCNLHLSSRSLATSPASQCCKIKISLPIN